MKSAIVKLGVLLFIVFLQISCKKEASLEKITDDISAQRSMELFDNEIDEIDEASINDEIGMPIGNERPDSMMDPISPCAVRTWSGDSTERVLTIDFGDEPCLCRDSAFRSGKIKITFTGRKFEPGATKTILFIDYKVNDCLFNGKVLVKYNGNGTFSRQNLGITMEVNGKVSNWFGLHTITIVEGFETPQMEDNVRRVEGKSWGKNLFGVPFTRIVTQPLIRRGMCARHFVEGIVKTEMENGNVSILNFDPFENGICDNIASITINQNEPVLIELNRRF